MAKFLYLFRGGDAGMADFTPEQGQAHMQEWISWMQELASKGHQGEGEPLSNEGKIVRKEEIVDGPHAEGAEMVGGYVIVEAADLDEAVELAKGCPIYQVGGETEVRPIIIMEEG